LDQHIRILDDGGGDLSASRSGQFNPRRIV